MVKYWELFQVWIAEKYIKNIMALPFLYCCRISVCLAWYWYGRRVIEAGRWRYASVSLVRCGTAPPLVFSSEHGVAKSFDFISRFPTRSPALPRCSIAKFIFRLFCVGISRVCLPRYYGWARIRVYLENKICLSIYLYRIYRSGS